MLDVRLKDAIRQTDQTVQGLKLEIAAIKEDLETLTQLVRDIKRSVVRKYGDKNGS